MTPLDADDERRLTHLLDVVEDEVAALDEAAARARQRGDAFGLYPLVERAAALRLAAAAATRVFARLGVPWRAPPLRPPTPRDDF